MFETPHEANLSALSECNQRVVGEIQKDFKKNLRILRKQSRADLHRLLLDHIETVSVVHTDSLPSCRAIFPSRFTHTSVNHPVSLRIVKTVHLMAVFTEALK